VNSQAGKFFQR